MCREMCGNFRVWIFDVGKRLVQLMNGEEKRKKERNQRGEEAIKYSKRASTWGPEADLYFPHLET